MKVKTQNQAIKALAEVPTPFATIAVELIERYNNNNGASMKPVDIIQFANLAVAVADFLRLNRQIKRADFIMHMGWGPDTAAWHTYEDLPGWIDFEHVYEHYFS